MWMWLLSCVALVLVAACEPEPADYPASEDVFGAAPPNELILLTGGGDLVSVDIEDSRAIGPEVNLILAPAAAGQEIRGIVFNRAVSLTVTPSGAAGIIGAAPFNLSIVQDRTGLHACGLVAGEPADYHLDDLHLSGTIGRCGYALTRSGRRYEGTRSCGGPPESVHLLLPAQLLRWNDSALAALLGLVLNTGYPPGRHT